MFKFKKKDKNSDKDKNSAKGKKTEDNSQKNVQTDGEPAKKSFFKRIFSLKFMIIFFILIVIIAGALFAGWFFFLKPNSTDTGESAKIEESAKTAEAAVDKDGKPIPPPEPDFPDVVDLEVFQKIQLQESEGLNYLTLKISVEIIAPEMRKEIEFNIGKIRQTVEVETKKMTWLLLRTPEGKLNFKYHLIQELNKILPSRMIKNIYFTAFWLQ